LGRAAGAGEAASHIIKELARIGDTQVEFLLLRGGYVYAANPRTPHMMRLLDLPPAAMAGAITYHDYYIRTEIGRLCLDRGSCFRQERALPRPLTSTGK